MANNNILILTRSEIADGFIPKQQGYFPLNTSALDVLVDVLMSIDSAGGEADEARGSSSKAA